MQFARKAFTEHLEPRTLLAAASLLTDVNPVTPSSSPVGTVAVGNRAFFWRALSGLAGEIYVTDGTAAGTQDVFPTTYRYPALTGGASRAYFVLQNSVYETDGTTAGTLPLVSSLNVVPTYLYTRGDSLWFFARDASSQTSQLFHSDGTAAGTSVVANLPAGHAPLEDLGNGYEHLSPLACANGLFYFLTSSDGSSATSLWRSDGTSDGTFILKTFTMSSVLPNGRVSCQTDVDGKLYFKVHSSNVGSSDNDLWKTDGTIAGTTVVRSNIGPSAGEFVSYNGALYFRGFQSSTGYELWRSNASGTSIVKDMTPGSTSSYYGNTTVAGGFIYLASGGSSSDSTAQAGPQLWRSDGSAAGTSLVTTLPSSIRSFTAAGSYVFASTLELYRTDGTPGGTVNVQPANAPNRALQYPVAIAGNLIFTLDHPVYGSELFRATGDPGGSSLLVDLTPESYDSDPVAFGPYNGSIYFSADYQPDTSGLFRSDGTSAGTVLFKDGLSDVKFPTVVNGILYFQGTDHGGRNGELFRSDGTDTGTYFVKDLQTTTTGGANVSSLTELNGKLLFVAAPSPNSANVWVSDGTAAGTLQLNTLRVDGIASGQTTLPKAGQFVFFGANDSASGGVGDELWRTDGTLAGTQMVRDIFPGSGSSHPSILATMNDRLYFVANDGSGAGYQLWSTDGTPQGTFKVSPAPLDVFGTANVGVPLGDVLYFTSGSTGNAGTLWRTDGTAAGTTQIFALPSTIDGLAVSGGRIYFSDLISGGTFRNELWVSDGTTAGTRKLFSIQSGGFPQLLDVNGTLYFTSASRLWATDGTGVFSIAGADTPQKLFTLSGAVYFSGTDVQHGREPWKVQAAALQPAWLSASTDAVYQLTGADLSITSGTVTLTGDAAQTHPNLNLTIESGAQVIFAAREHLGSLGLNGTAQALTVAGGSNTIAVQALSVGSNATFDLNNNSLIVDYSETSPLSGIADRIRTARNGGVWTGTGITSLAARNANPHNTTLGVLEAADFKSIYGGTALFAGEQIDATAVLVKYTYYGDTDFNGVVNFDDYSRTDAGFNRNKSGWLNGDFDGNGVVDFDDYSLIDLAFNTQGAPLRAGSSKALPRAREIA